MTTRRPGRTQRIAFDETPLSAAHPNIDARIGWLLAMSRLHHADETYQDGRRFAEALGEAGFPASRSLLSRWESGEIPISYEGMTAYEPVLGLEVGQISSITGYIKASIPALKTRVVRPKLDPTTRGVRRPTRRAPRRGGGRHGVRPGLAGARLALRGGADGAPATSHLGGR